MFVGVMCCESVLRVVSVLVCVTCGECVLRVVSVVRRGVCECSQHEVLSLQVLVLVLQFSDLFLQKLHLLPDRQHQVTLHKVLHTHIHTRTKLRVTLFSLQPAGGTITLKMCHQAKTTF